MRCRVGDLAVIVKDEDFPANVGKFVTVLKRANPEEFWGGHAYIGNEWECQPASPLWGFDDDERTRAVYDDYLIAIPDDELRPIRDNPGADETLTWKPVEKPVEHIDVIKERV